MAASSGLRATLQRMEARQQEERNGGPGDAGAKFLCSAEPGACLMLIFNSVLQVCGVLTCSDDLQLLLTSYMNGSGGRAALHSISGVCYHTIVKSAVCPCLPDKLAVSKLRIRRAAEPEGCQACMLRF